MKDIHCQFCNTLLINKQCNYCHCSIFFLNKLVLKTQNKKKLSYDFLNSENIATSKEINSHEPLFNLINSKYSIPESILINLVKLRFLRKISDIEVLENKSSIIYFVKKDFSFIDKFENSYFYLYASYSLKDFNYSPKYFLKRYILLKEENNLNYFLNINNNSISLFIEFQQKHLFPYDENILSADEKNKLYSELRKKSLYTYFDLTESINFKIYAEYMVAPRDKYEAISLDDLHNNIINAIKKHQQIIEQFKQNYLKFFERALLESEISSF